MRLIAIQTSGIIELLSKCFSTKGDKARDDADNIKMRCFMTAILAYLPFNHLGDVLFPLYSISEIVALEGNEIAQNLKDILVSNGFADAEIDPNYIDDVEKAVGKKKNPSRTKTLAVMRKAAQFDTSSLFSQLCFQGCSFVVVSSSSIFLSFGSIQMSTMNFHRRRVPIYLFLLNCILHQKRLFHWSQFTQLPIQLSPNRGWCLFGSLSFMLSLFILLFSSLVDA